MCVKYDYSEYDLKDKAYIYYLIPDQEKGYIFSDKGMTGQLGDTYDYHNYTGLQWTLDTNSGGSNDIEGRGHFDGVFYWFEIKKPLNNEDPRDWKLQLDEVYGQASSPISKNEHMCIGIFDDSEKYDIQTFVQLSLAGQSPNQIQTVGGKVEDIPEVEVIKPILYRLTLCIMVLLVTTIKIVKTR